MFLQYRVRDVSVVGCFSLNNKTPLEVDGEVVGYIQDFKFEHSPENAFPDSDFSVSEQSNSEETELEKLKHERDKLEFKKQTEILMPEEEKSLQESIDQLTEEIRILKGESNEGADYAGEVSDDVFRSLDEHFELDNMNEEDRVREAVVEFQEMFSSPDDISKSIYGDVAESFGIRYMVTGLVREVNNHYDRSVDEWIEPSIGSDEHDGLDYY